MLRTCKQVRSRTFHYFIFSCKLTRLHLGGGIVFDSDPYDEYIETINKLGASTKTITKAEEEYSKLQSKGPAPDTAKNAHIDLAAG